MARPPHATWYARRVSSPPALQGLTCRLGAPARPCNERAVSYPRHLCSGNTPTLYIAFWILDAKVARPPHATWYVRRVSLPPALKGLTCRLGAPAHPWNERASSYPGRCRSVWSRTSGRTRASYWPGQYGAWRLPGSLRNKSSAGRWTGSQRHAKKLEGNRGTHGFCGTGESGVPTHPRKDSRAEKRPFGVENRDEGSLE